jgi:hypothetical protein
LPPHQWELRQGGTSCGGLVTKDWPHANVVKSDLSAPAICSDRKRGEPRHGSSVIKATSQIKSVLVDSSCVDELRNGDSIYAQKPLKVSVSMKALADFGARHPVKITMRPALQCRSPYIRDRSKPLATNAVFGKQGMQKALLKPVSKKRSDLDKIKGEWPSQCLNALLDRVAPANLYRPAPCRLREVNSAFLPDRISAHAALSRLLA